MPRSVAPALSPHFPASGFTPPPSSGFHPSSTWNPLAIALVGAICTVFLFLSCHQIQRHCYVFQMITFSGNRAQRQRRRLNEHNPDEPSQQFRSQGLDPYITRSLPIIQFKKKDEGELSQSSTECAVCLGEFEGGEGLKQLPNCSHFFHVSCIDTWLMTHSSCPLCRSQVFNHEYSVSVCSVEENLSREDLLRERSAMHQVLRSHILHSSILRE